MQYKRALRIRIFATAFAGLLIAAAITPLASAPAEAAPANLTISGRVATDPSATYLVHNFHVQLRQPGEVWPSVYEEFRGTEFSITAPEPGVYTLHISPIWSDSPSPWTGAWLGDTPFPWHATEITVDGEAPITDLVVTVPEAGSVSGNITAPTPPYRLNYGLTADAFLLDPATGRYQHIAGATRDFDGPYTINALPPGSYVVRFGHRGANWPEQSRTFPSEYYAESRYLEEAQPIELMTGDAVEGIDGALDRWSFDVTRTAGADRYETAVRLSEGAFEAGVPAVYLASGTAWADALSAAPAAAHRDGPLLLTAPDHVPAVVLSELARLQPGEIIIAGGPAVVSNTVLDSLAAQGYSVRRVAGADRYDTSRRVAVDAFAGAPDEISAWLATGRGFADALSAAATASSGDHPLILIDGASPAVDEPTLHAFSELGITQFQVAGGPAAIGESYFASLQVAFGGGMVYRYGGGDRYETSRLIAELSTRSFSVSTGRAFLASGTGYADALAAAPIAGLTISPLLLTPGNCVPSASIASMVKIDAFHVELVGGPAVLGAGVENLTPC